MPIGQADLSVRTYERVACALPAEVWIGEHDQEQVRLAGSARNAEGAVGVTVVDCSLGGLGLNSPVYLPKGCCLRVRVVVRDAAGGPFSVIEAMIRVKRTAMVDRVPRYYLGASFEHGDAAAAPLLDLARRAQSAGGPERA